MKILAFNACGEKDTGVTSEILDAFLNGAKDSGAETELLNVDNLDIQPCRACTDEAFFESSGKCQCDDDMNALYPKFQESEVWVFASPNNPECMNGKFKHLLDRMEPLFQPFTLRTNGETKIVLNESDNKGKVVFISSGNDWDVEQFDMITGHIRQISGIFDREFSCALLRPHENAMKALDQLGIPHKDILDAAFDAGKEIVTNGAVKTDTVDKVCRELVPNDSFILELCKCI